MIVVAAMLGCAPGVAQADPDGVVGHAPAAVLHDSGDLRVERDAWRDESGSFVAWRVRLPRDAAMTVGAAGTVVPFASLLPADNGPWVAINGGFYDMGAPMGLVVSGGSERAPLKHGGGSGVIAATPTGPVIVRRDDYVAGATDAVQSIDRLVDDGKNLVHDPGGRRAARSFVAVTDDSTWVVAIVDSSSLGYDGENVDLVDTADRGPTLWEAARYAIDELHAAQAINLDGAVSTQLAVADGDYRLEIHGERGTVNAPTFRPRSSR
jgi:hypothetical protein